MAQRIVVHAGFHKTGTTSAQRFLRANAKVIRPHAALVLPWRLRKGPARLSARYAQYRTEQLLDAFATELDALLQDTDLGARRGLILSDENLAGRMPGRDGLTGYDAAPALLGRMGQVLRSRFGDTADIRFCLVTREPQSWIRSLWAHNLRTTRMTLDLVEFRGQMQGLIEIEPLLDRITQAVAPATLTTATLEEMSDGPEGPARLLLDQIGLPAELRDLLAPQPRRNASPEAAVTAELLAMNRSHLDDDALAQQKADLLQVAEGESTAAEGETNVG